MLVFITVAMTTWVCNVSQGQCSFVSPAVMQGVFAAGVLELIFEGAAGMIKIHRKKDDTEN
jgi:hypothetical protein